MIGKCISRKIDAFPYNMRDSIRSRSKKYEFKGLQIHLFYLGKCNKLTQFFF